jgi:hypothetical protein
MFLEFLPVALEFFKEHYLLTQTKSLHFVLTSCALHNLLRSKTSSRKIYTPEGMFDNDDDLGELRTASRDSCFVNFVQQGGNRNNTDARAVRDKFCDYFNTNGQVEWQWDVI